jgi:ABC-type amino acid transport substrate-binding protein/serine phosphatase RsbU (regulator of sigma subunit)
LYKILYIFILFCTLLYSKTIRVSYDPDYAPLSYSIDGQEYGLLIDIWKLWGKKSAYSIDFVEAKDWDSAIELAKSGKVDLFLGTNPYESWMKASMPYYRIDTSIFLLKSFSDKREISTIGIIGDDYKEDILDKFKHIKITSYSNYKELIEAMIEKRVDAIYDDSIAISYFAIKNGYIHLLKKDNRLIKISDISAISNNQKNIDIFNRWFKKIAVKELIEIERNWIPNKNQRYFENCKTDIIRYVYDPDWKPFEYVDSMTKEHQGIIADILSIISTKTGIKFEAIYSDSWAKSIELVKSKKADMFSAVPVTDERKEYLNFTKHNIYSYPAVFVSSIDRDIVFNDSYQGKNIGIVKGNSLGNWLKSRYPAANYIEYKNVLEAFEAIESGDIDYFGINGITAQYYIKVLGFNESKIYTKMDYMFNLKIALRKDLDTTLLSSIDDALSSISQKELSDIYHKWTSIKIKKELNWKLLATIFFIIFLLIVVSILINRRLKQLVDKKTIELRKLNENLEDLVDIRTQEIKEVNRKLYDNIEYASLIQNSILPSKEQMDRCFEDHFIIWQPKDSVGGDIYFFHTLDRDRYLLFIIDCTGHGVSGAFVTMLIKALQEQFVLENRDRDISPAKALEYFNISIKQLLNQDSVDSNVGLDIAVVLIDRGEMVVKFAGANIPLYYMEDDSLHVVKPDRYSVGYRQCDISYSYHQKSILLKRDMKFYITTDGYIDQNGGVKGFPFGKRRFKSIIEESYRDSFDRQKKIFIERLDSYQDREERNDDITLIGFEISIDI